MRGSVLRAIAGAVLGVSFYGNSAHGLDYDVAVAGSIGKKSYVCIVKDDALRVRLERSPGSGKIVSPQSALGKAKRSITNLREKIKSAATKKKKSSLRTKLSGVRETKSELGRCKAGTLPLEVGTDGGDFVLSIPLSALPEGFDPNDIGISTPESIEGAEFTPTPDRIFQLEPSGTTFSEAITVTLRTATGSGGSFGLIHLSLQTSDEAGEHFVVESLEPSTSVEEDESGEERQMLTTVEISSFSSIVKLESELAAPAVALVGVAEEQTVGVPFTAIGRAAYSAA
ncbi:MAG: hypothetical protein KDD64_14275, partial [Bdellovibrionales bacterium]|nr:hypothetical protein [Bdellovibrionales bacterium]